MVPATRAIVAGDKQEISTLRQGQIHIDQRDAVVCVRYIEHIAVSRDEAATGYGEAACSHFCITWHTLIEHNVLKVPTAFTVSTAHIPDNIAINKRDRVKAFNDHRFGIDGGQRCVADHEI